MAPCILRRLHLTSILEDLHQTYFKSEDGNLINYKKINKQTNTNKQQEAIGGNMGPEKAWERSITFPLALINIPLPNVSDLKGFMEAWSVE